MAACIGQISCNLSVGPFSGEVVFYIQTDAGPYSGLAPKHYASSSKPLLRTPIPGKLRVKILRNGGGQAVVQVPDGEALTVSADLVKT